VGKRDRHRNRTGTAIRLAAFHGGVLAVVLGVVVTALVHQFSVSYETLAANDLVGELRAYTTAVSRTPPDKSLLSASVGYLRSRSLPDGTVVVVAFPGTRLIATPGADALRSDPIAARWITTPPSTSVVEATQVGDKQVELLAAPIRIGPRTVGSLLATTDLSLLRAQQSRVLTLSAAEAAVALLAGVLSSYLLLRRLLRTVGRITHTAGEIGQGGLNRRLGDQGTDDEVGQLATTFDAMIDRLDEAMTAQRRLLSDVSHQLRTPLTVARGHLEVLQRTGGLADNEGAEATVEVVVDELDHMRGLVERLLLLGRAMEPDFVDLEPVDARAFVADIYDAARVIAPRRWSLSQVPDVVLLADATKLRGAILNLVDNAVRATSPDDAIEFVTTLDPALGTLSLAVEDSGPGIPIAQRDAVLARFSRPGARGEDGTGLGLAIAKAVAEAHGASLEVGDSSLGGARVAIVMPPSSLASSGTR
jgi:signal transduction histidine kinase